MDEARLEWFFDRLREEGELVEQERRRVRLDAMARLYPVVGHADSDVYLFGNGLGALVVGLGPYWPEPNFGIEEIPAGRWAWRYIISHPLPLRLVDLVEDAPDTSVKLDIREIQLHQWGLLGPGVFYSWWIGFVPDPKYPHYVFWEVPAARLPLR